MKSYLFSNRLTNALAGSETFTHALPLKEGSSVKMAFLQHRPQPLLTSTATWESHFECSVELSIIATVHRTVTTAITLTVKLERPYGFASQSKSSQNLIDSSILAVVKRLDFWMKLILHRCCPNIAQGSCTPRRLLSIPYG